VLKEFEETHVWFRPMMNTVGKRLLAKSNFGAKLRLCVASRNGNLIYPTPPNPTLLFVLAAPWEPRSARSI